MFTLGASFERHPHLPPREQDSRGYTPSHVASQYGHTAVLYHFKAGPLGKRCACPRHHEPRRRLAPQVRWDADAEVLDTDGRTPLHWAAYKGFADSIRLLLFMDADQMRQDREGCTPLHWAAIKGNAEAVYLLTQAGGVPALTVRDNTGSTPTQLAQEKKHTMLAGCALKCRPALACPLLFPLFPVRAFSLCAPQVPGQCAGPHGAQKGCQDVAALDESADAGPHHWPGFAVHQQRGALPCAAAQRRGRGPLGVGGHTLCWWRPGVHVPHSLQRSRSAAGGP